MLSIRSDNVLVGFVDERGDRLPRPQRLDECAARRINSRLRGAFLKAVETIKSDYERGRVLAALLKNKQIS